MWAQKLSHSSATKIDPEDEFAPDPYNSDGEDTSNGSDNYTPAVREMLKKCVDSTFSNFAKLTILDVDSPAPAIPRRPK